MLIYRARVNVYVKGLVFILFFASFIFSLVANSGTYDKVNTKITSSHQVSIHRTLNSSDNENSLTKQSTKRVSLQHGVDDSAENVPVYIITTSNATYYLEKQGGGLSSMLDINGVDWLGFHPQKGSGHKGEYRGFPNAIHKQDGNYFHAMNSGTEPASSTVEIDSEQHVRIVFISANRQWEGQWDFYQDRLDFTMIKVSKGFNYWIQYEGVPNGEMDDADYWFSSADNIKRTVREPFLGDLPSPEWIAFGDGSTKSESSRVLYLYHHQDDKHPDYYVSRPDMTVFGFGRRNKEKFLNIPQSFSIGFIESTSYQEVKAVIETIQP